MLHVSDYREPTITPVCLLVKETAQLASLRSMRSKAESIEELGAQCLNSQQRLAVASVLVGAGGGRLPLALFGPPGTGKTVTLVECALQVSKL